MTAEETTRDTSLPHRRPATSKVPDVTTNRAAVSRREDGPQQRHRIARQDRAVDPTGLLAFARDRGLTADHVRAARLAGTVYIALS